MAGKLCCEETGQSAVLIASVQSSVVSNCAVPEDQSLSGRHTYVPKYMRMRTENFFNCAKKRLVFKHMGGAILS